VRVQVSRVDLDARKIDFRLVRDTPIKPPSSRGAALEKSGSERGDGGPRVRSLAPGDGAHRKKAAPAPSVAVKEARAARGAAKKRSSSRSASAKSAKGQSRKKR